MISLATHSFIKRRAGTLPLACKHHGQGVLDMVMGMTVFPGQEIYTTKNLGCHAQVWWSLNARCFQGTLLEHGGAQVAASFPYGSHQ
jgi:hypothetical protein